MKTLPVCVGVQKAHSWAGLGESERLRRGQGDCKTEFPERFEEGTNGRQRPLLSPGPCWCLRGHMDACLCVPSHQPILHPPPPPLLRDRTVHVNESWPEWRGPLQLRGINSVCFFVLFFYFLPSSFSSLSFPPRKQHSTICIAAHLFSQSSLFPFEASQTQCENLATDSCPLYYTATPSPPSVPTAFFSGRIPAVSCDYRFAGLLLTWGGPSTLRRPYFIPMKERNEWSPESWRGSRYNTLQGKQPPHKCCEQCNRSKGLPSSKNKNEWGNHFFFFFSCRPSCWRNQ